VFSKDSKYMTVHQAKGLEWKKVIVSVTPSSRNDKTTLLALFSNPKILQETPQDEFTRMYYVACSRATEELYIHLPDDTHLLTTIETNLNSFRQQHNCRLEYEIIK
jgi:DNA helicase-2/ATP-dependent DNA helicase PcrA